jgi:hypothetical protein
MFYDKWYKDIEKCMPVDITYKIQKHTFCKYNE